MISEAKCVVNYLPLVDLAACDFKMIIQKLTCNDCSTIAFMFALVVKYFIDYKWLFRRFKNISNLHLEFVFCSDFKALCSWSHMYCTWSYLPCNRHLLIQSFTKV